MSKSYFGTTTFILVSLFFVSLWLTMGFGGCMMHPDSAKRILQSAGYTQVEITHWRPFMGGQKDWYNTGFKAVGPNGQTVTGCVSEGLLLKGSTIRFD